MRNERREKALVSARHVGLCNKDGESVCASAHPSIVTGHVHAAPGVGVLAIIKVASVSAIVATLFWIVRVVQAEVIDVGQGERVECVNERVYSVLCKIDDQCVNKHVDHAPRVAILAADLLANGGRRVGNLAPLRLQHRHKLAHAAGYARPAKALRDQPADEHDVVPERRHNVGDGRADVGGTLLVAPVKGNGGVAWLVQR